MSSNSQNEKFSLLILTAVIFVVGVIFLSCLILGTEYLDYKNMYSEGYEVRFEPLGYGCEILIEHPTGDRTWEYCSTAGENYVIKNFAVKR